MMPRKLGKSIPSRLRCGLVILMAFLMAVPSHVMASPPKDPMKNHLTPDDEFGANFEFPHLDPEEIQADASKLEEILNLINSSFKINPESRNADQLMEDWGHRALKIQSEVYLLFQGVLRKRDEIQKQNPNITDQEFLKNFIEKNQVKYYIKGVGKGELNNIDGQPFVRITHVDTELSFIILPESIRFEKDHFRQYISRQHIQAGTERIDGQHGRDVVVAVLPTLDVAKDDEFFESAHLFEMKRFGMFTPEFWQEYWWSLWKKPGFNQFTFAVFNGSFQFLTSLAVTGVMTSFSLPSKNPELAAATALSWGALIGTVYSSYTAWTDFGIPLKIPIAGKFHVPLPSTRELKVWSNGIVYAYLLSFVLSHGDLSKFDPTTMSGLMENMLLWSTTLLNSKSKPYWNDFANVLEKVGIARGTVNMGPWNTGWSKKILYNSLFYLFNFSFRLVERVFNASGMRSVGVGVLLLQVPIAHYSLILFSKYIAKKTGHIDAEIYTQLKEQEWKAKWKNYFRYLGFLRRKNPKLAPSIPEESVLEAVPEQIEKEVALQVEQNALLVDKMSPLYALYEPKDPVEIKAEKNPSKVTSKIFDQQDSVRSVFSCGNIFKR